MDYDGLRRILVDFYVKVLAYVQPHLSVDEIQNLAANASTIAIEYGKAHPYQTAFTAVSVGLSPIFGAGWMTASLLKLIGFGSLGPIAGEKWLLFMCGSRRLTRYTTRHYGFVVPSHLARCLHFAGQCLRCTPTLGNDISMRKRMELPHMIDGTACASCDEELMWHRIRGYDGVYRGGKVEDNRKDIALC
jgi:hypothetical protein